MFRNIIQYCWKCFQELTFTSKKWSAHLVKFLHFLVWLKMCFLRLQLAYKETSIFLLPHTIFSHFWKNDVSQYCSILIKVLPKAYFYVKKVLRPLGQILTFSVLTKTLNLEKVSFWKHFGQYWTILRKIIFSKMWENCVRMQENWAFLVSWLKLWKTRFWSKQKM